MTETKYWTAPGITTYCELLPLGLQSEFPRHIVVLVFQSENQTLPGVVAFMLPSETTLTFQRREPAKGIPVRVQNERQCVRASRSAETVAVSSP
jgi:hypothetical protein